MDGSADPLGTPAPEPLAEAVTAGAEEAPGRTGSWRMPRDGGGVRWGWAGGSWSAAQTAVSSRSGTAQSIGSSEE